MSYSTPSSYNSPQPTMGLPEELIGTELKSFAARSNIRYSPSISGSSVGPSSSMLFSIANDQAFVKPNSITLRCKITVVGAFGAGARYMFAGQSSATIPAAGATGHGVGGASSVIQRVTVGLPGVSMTYNNFSHVQNAFVKPHCLSSLYVSNDLKQLEHANTVRDFTTAYDDVSRSSWVSIPLNIPLFNCGQALPLCLLSAPITIEVNTNTVIDAFCMSSTTLGTGTVTSYTIDNSALVYETITPSQEFISALKQAKQASPYTMALNDWSCLSSGVSGAGIQRLQFGLGLASYRGCVFSFQNQPTVTTEAKFYRSNGMVSWTGYVDGVMVTPPNLDSSDAVYLEATRAVQRYNDSDRESYFTSLAGGTVSSTLRNNYESCIFFAGVSTSILSSESLSQQGIPAGTLVLELNLAATRDLGKWQTTDAAAASNVYVLNLYDSALSIDAMGICTLRR